VFDSGLRNLHQGGELLEEDLKIKVIEFFNPLEIVAEVEEKGSYRQALDSGRQRIHGYANRNLEFVKLSKVDMHLSTGICIAVDRRNLVYQ